MRKIFGIGESVLDIIFKNDQPQAAKPGGSVLNSVVSMGRIGLPVSFISEYGRDDVGDLIDNFLKNNGVDSSFVNRFHGGNTALAMAFLNENNDAHYNFYKNYPDKRLGIVFPDTARDDIILIGSYYAIWDEIRDQYKNFITGAKERGALIIYDPNFRKTHLSELNVLKPLIIENIQMATILRGSDEDFKNIFGTDSPDEAWEIVKGSCKCLVYTANVEGVYVRTPSFSGMFPVQRIIPVSTIGAGDNFNAGMITAIYNNSIKASGLDELTEPEWSTIISMAVDFATNVCLSYENYISLDFTEEFKKRKTNN